LKLIVDACSTINLHNGSMLEAVLDLGSSGFVFHIGTIVRGECGDLTPFLDEQVKRGRMTILPGKIITPVIFAEVLNQYELGLGETECIVHAEQKTLVVCTDDMAARAVAKIRLGEARVLGSLRLIRQCVCEGSLTSAEAYARYELMRSRGAFLPDVPSSYFDC
jgi:predicted nucleic acid-binding protein